MLYSEKRWNIHHVVNFHTRTRKMFDASNILRIFTFLLFQKLTCWRTFVPKISPVGEILMLRRVISHPLLFRSFSIYKKAWNEQKQPSRGGIRKRSSENMQPDMLLGKGILKICSKFTGEHPCWSTISIKLLCNFNKITVWHGCSRINLLHIFRMPFPKNISGGLLLKDYG